MEDRRITTPTIREQLNPKMQEYLETPGSGFQHRYEVIAKAIEERPELVSAEVRELMRQLVEREDPVSFELPEKPVALPQSGGVYHYFDYDSLERTRRYISAKEAYVNFNPLTNNELSHTDLLALVPAKEYYLEIKNILTELEYRLGLRQKEISEEQTEEREKVREKEREEPQASSPQIRRNLADTWSQSEDNRTKVTISTLSLQDKSQLAVLNVKVDALLRQSILLQSFCDKFSYHRSFRKDELKGVPQIQALCNRQIPELQELARSVHMQQIDPSKMKELKAKLQANQEELEDHFRAMFDKAKNADIGTVREWATILQDYNNFLNGLNKLNSPDENTDLTQWEIDHFKSLATWETAFRKSLMGRFRYSNFSLYHEDKSVPVIRIGVVGNIGIDSYAVIERCCGGEAKKESGDKQKTFSLMGGEMTFEDQAIHMKFSNCNRPEQGFTEIASSAYRQFDMFIIVCDMKDSLWVKDVVGWYNEIKRNRPGSNIAVAVINSNPALTMVIDEMVINERTIKEKMNALLGDPRNCYFIVDPYRANGGCEAMVNSLAATYIENHEEKFKNLIKSSPRKTEEKVKEDHVTSRQSSSPSWFYRQTSNFLNFLGSNQTNVKLKPKQEPPPQPGKK